MWTEITRGQYERSGLRYASDLTDEEWTVIAPYLPARKRHGRPRTADLREVLNAILVYGAHRLPMADVAEGVPAAQHDPALLLRLAFRRDVARSQPPSSLGRARSGGIRGFDAGKKVKGRKAPYHHRYRWIAGRRHGPRRRYPGPGWRPGGGRRKALTMPRRTRGFLPIRRKADTISMGLYH